MVTGCWLLALLHKNPACAAYASQLTESLKRRPAVHTEWPSPERAEGGLTGPSAPAGPRQQLNLASAFLDGSALYGTDKHAAKRVRSYSGGRLRLGPGSTLPRGTSAPCRSAKERCESQQPPLPHSLSAKFSMARTQPVTYL